MTTGVTIPDLAENPVRAALVDAPLVIAHRGASGHRPEHTLAAYELAIELGADYVEPDLVPTRDGVLVARHENELSATTDVAQHRRFAARRTTRAVDGRWMTGWFTEDFTLAELKTLRATERWPDPRRASTEHDRRYEIPTFEEVLALVERQGRRRGQAAGVYPELKHPTYFRSRGLPVEQLLARTLAEHRLDRPNASVLVQSFEPSSLRRLAGLVRVPLVQLISTSGGPHDLATADHRRGYRDLLTPARLREISTYAVALGLHKHLVIPRDVTGHLTRPSSLVASAHAAGLCVHAYTFRDDERFLSTNLRTAGGGLAEQRAFLDAGVDGVFTDHVDTAVRARTAFLGVTAGLN